jgi:hypothetical protein
MSWGICDDCGSEVHWRNRRGSHISDSRCTCGGRVHGMNSGTVCASKGRNYLTCALCGKRRLHLRTLSEDRTYWNGRMIPAGSTVCPWHEAREDRVVPA